MGYSFLNSSWFLIKIKGNDWSFQSSRTNIRSRFQRWKASSFGHNVSKGSRQNSTVTLGKGVAQGEENWNGRVLRMRSEKEIEMRGWGGEEEWEWVKSFLLFFLSSFFLFQSHFVIASDTSKNCVKKINFYPWTDAY